MPQNIFEISYKLRYCETEDWGSELLKAETEKAALARFAKERHIKPKEFKTIEDWRWNEGVWMGFFRNIRQVKLIRCPHCNGAGEISV